MSDEKEMEYTPERLEASVADSDPEVQQMHKEGVPVVHYEGVLTW